MKRFLSFRGIVVLMGLLIVLVTAGNWIENWTGQKALAVATQRLAQSGETLNFAELLPKPVPDAANFCALPLLMGITQKYEEGGSGATTAAHKTLRKLDWPWAVAAAPPVPLGKIDLDQLLSEGRRPRKPTPMLTNGCTLAQPFDFASAADYLREVAYIDTPDTASPAEILVSIDRLHPVLKQLSDAAPDRQKAVLSPPPGTGYEGMAAALPRDYLESFLQTVKALALRAQMATKAGDAESATRSIQAAQKFSQAVEGDPSLIALLVAVTFSPYEFNSVWSLLHSGGATEAQLAAIQKGLEEQDFMRHGLQAIRGELTIQVSAVEWLKRHPGERVHAVVSAASLVGVADDVSWWKKALVENLPSGWFDHNAANIIQLHVSYLREPWAKGDGATIMRRFDELGTLLGEGHGTHHLLPALSMPSYWGILRGVIYTEAVRRQALLAVALERHRLAHGKLPAHLSDLVPAFLSAVPEDPMTREPMRYRVEEDVFTLWSVGFDLRNDHGALPEGRAARRLTYSDYRGDWVWKSRQ